MSKSGKNTKSKTVSQDWIDFGFRLEEALGDLHKPEDTLQIFSDILKDQVSYNYLEISVLPEMLPEDGEPTNWVRNDTGYGGKLLSIILTDHFMRGLSRRRRPVAIRFASSNKIVENTELLRVMELYSGMLIPLIQEDKTHGVMKLFFNRRLRFTEERKEWLLTSASILQRALTRSWRYQAAEKMATIDSLTGLYNHRYFMDQLKKEFTRARRYRNWLSLIMIDIDHFKQYNDNNGHLAGDQVLKRVAQSIRESVREMDLVARWGGEEFALLLPEINAKNGMIVAEKIRREVEAQRFKNQSQQPNGNLTISLGVAENAAELKGYKDLFNRADAALYEAKHAGRNRCAVAN